MPFEMAPAVTFLHQWLLPCSSNNHSCTGNHFPAEAATSPALVTTFLQQRLPSCISSYQLCTSSYQPCFSIHLPAPATISPAPATTFLHQQLPTATSPEPTTTFLHQQIPVLNQQPPSCTSRYQSWTSDAQFNNYQSCTSNPDLHQRLDPAPVIPIQPW